MRITFVLPHASLNGGVRVCAIYADYLQKRGHDVCVVSRPWPDFSWRTKFRHALTGQPIHRPRTQESHFDRVNVEKRIIDRYRPIEARDVPDSDVVIATWWETAEWVSAFPESKGRHVHLIQHDERQFPNQDEARVDATWKLPDFHRVVVARWLAELARDRYGCHDVHLINNGVDVDFFDAPTRGKQRGLTVGTMYSSLRFKGCDIAFKAIELVRSRGRDVRVMAFGSESIHETVKPPAGTQLEFRPTQERIRKIYSSCDAWLFASRCEGFGLPILEAMACRTPVIGTPTGAAPELISDGGGLLVEMENPESMAKAIDQIADMTDDAWRQLSMTAYQTSRRHSWSASSAAFEELLLKIA